MCVQSTYSNNSVKSVPFQYNKSTERRYTGGGCEYISEINASSVCVAKNNMKGKR